MDWEKYHSATKEQRKQMTRFDRQQQRRREREKEKSLIKDKLILKRKINLILKKAKIKRAHWTASSRVKGWGHYYDLGFEVTIPSPSADYVRLDIHGERATKEERDDIANKIIKVIQDKGYKVTVSEDLNYGIQIRA